jgi:hypothetical protein
MDIKYEFLPFWFSYVIEEYQDGKNSYYGFFGLSALSDSCAS